MSVPWVQWLPMLLDGTIITIQVAVLSGVVALFLSVIAGLGRLSRYRLVRGIATTYVEFFRSCSLLVLLFWVYFALPFAGIELNKLLSAVLAIGLNIGAYGAEIVRSSIAAIPKGQSEASTALNLTAAQRLWYIILPQAVARMLPPMGNLLIEMIKSTSLVYFITLSDLTYQAMILRNNFYTWTPYIFGLLLVIYFILSTCVALMVRLLERRFAAWR